MVNGLAVDHFYIKRDLHMPYVTELVVGSCVVRRQSDSILRVKQRSWSERLGVRHVGRGRAPAGVLCEALLYGCRIHCVWDSRGLLLSD